MILHKYKGKEKDIIIPTDLNITEIHGHAFSESEALSITIPEGVKKLRRRSFYYSKNLKSIVFLSPS